jgi:hypothetical protein
MPSLAQNSGRADGVFYSVFGLAIRSTIQLPFPTLGDYGARPCVDIRLSSSTGAMDTALAPHDRISGSREILTVRAPGVAVCQILDGRQITLERMAGACDAELSRFVAGTALGILALQRCLLPLHASAIATSNGCVAFAGRKGAGKSTLAARFARAGYETVCDDVLVVGADTHGTPSAWPNAPHLKLWDSALAALGHDRADLPPVAQGLPKYRLDTAGPGTGGALPLQRIYLLNEEATDDPSAIVRLRGLPALRALARQSHAWGRLSQFFDRGGQLQSAAQILQSTPLYALTVRRGFDQLDTEAARIERHWHEAASA